MNIENRIEALGIKLPVPPLPVANYVACKKSGNLVYVSGQGPIIEGKQLYKGKVGSGVNCQEGYQAARFCGINLLAQLKAFLGDLDKVKQVIHLKGFVASDNHFTEQPLVVNGASDLMVEVFGDSGRHTRCALGTNVLPTDIPVEVELVVEITE
ncbi:MAG: RidA family protein [Eubacteriales bacterium]|nr:RidA family protein [Eubacteriales bacterium]